MAIVFVGIGSNLGVREENIQRALELLRENEHVKVLEVASLIETEPEGEGLEGKFLNGAAKIDVDLMPLEVLSLFKNIERRLGRKKDESNAPRSIDLDILFYDDVIILEGKSLEIPHPRIASRPFVLNPLAEIAPDFIHPRLGKSIRELCESLQDENSKEPARA